MNPQKATLLDLFSGKGGFHNGLCRAGFKFDHVYFSEVDTNAIANYQYLFPEAHYVGSVTNIRGANLKRPNIITFGSPCQDFSLAGKRKGMDGARSSLISEAIRLITETRPDLFIWENVKGTFSSNNGADFWAIIKAFTNIGGYRLEWQLLNTSWFLPQNRERIYLVGTLATSRRSSGDIFPIRESTIRANQRQSNTPTVRCLTAGGKSGGHHSGMTLIKTVARINDSQDGQVFCETGHSQCLSSGHGNVPKVAIKQKPCGHNKGGLHNISPTITANSFEQNNHVTVGSLVGYNGKQSFRETTTCPTIMARARARARADGSGQPCIKIGAIRGRNPENPKSRIAGLDTEQMLGINEHGISNCLSTVQKDNVVVSGITMERTEQGKKLRKDYESGKVKHGFNEHRKETLRSDGLTNTLDTNIKSQKISDGTTIRRLTEIEGERLQGADDDSTKYGLYLPPEIQKYIFGNNRLHKSFDLQIKMLAKVLTSLKNKNRLIKKQIPATQRYKILGNSVTEDVVMAVGINTLKVLKETA